MKTLNELFISELSDIYDAEQRIAKALPEIATAATSKKLKAAINKHLKETEGHIKQVEAIFACFNEKPKTETCQATVGLIKESKEAAEDFKASPALDAALVACLQKVEHYEIATYGCLHAWAGHLKNTKAAALVEKILAQEHAANESLTEIAMEFVNLDAMETPEENGKRKNSTKLAA